MQKAKKKILPVMVSIVAIGCWQRPGGGPRPRKNAKSAHIIHAKAMCQRSAIMRPTERRTASPPSHWLDAEPA